MRHITDRHITAALFVGLLAAGAIAMTEAYMILGRMIVSAGEGEGSPLLVIAAGALVGTLTAYVIHEVDNVLPGVTLHLRIERSR